MIADELRVLFGEIRADILALRTDIIICKYGIEQIETKVDLLIANQSPSKDPMEGRIVEKF